MESRGRRTRFGFGSHPHHEDRSPQSSKRRRAPWLPTELQSTWQAMERDTGWSPEVALMPYAKLVLYRRVGPGDARDGNVWVDVVAGDGKPLRRQVGLLRYLGGVAFSDEDAAWAGIHLHDVRVASSENDGRVGGIRCVRTSVCVGCGLDRST